MTTASISLHSVQVMLLVCMARTEIEKNSLFAKEQDCDENDDYAWSWVSGRNVGNQPSIINQSTPSINTDLTAGDHDQHSYPGARSQAAVWSQQNGKVWLFGGLGYGDDTGEAAQLLNDLWTYDAVSMQWQCVHKGGPIQGTDNAVPSGRSGAVLCGVPDLVLVMHGGINHTDTWLYDVPTFTWLRLPQTPTMPRSRSDVSWCLTDQLIVLDAGVMGSIAPHLSSLSLRTIAWTSLPVHSSVSKRSHAFPVSRVGATLWTLGSSVFMYGGRISGRFRSTVDTTTLWQYNITNNTFTVIHKDQSPSSHHRAYPVAPLVHSTGWVDNQKRLCLFGGNRFLKAVSDQMSSELWCFDQEHLTWIRLNDCMPSLHNKDSDISKHSSLSSIPSARNGASVWLHSQVVYMFGGLGYDARNRTSYLQDLWMRTDVSLDRVLLRASENWLAEVSPAAIFLTCLGILGGMALIGGATLCIQKYLTQPYRKKSHGFTIKYSPLTQEAELVDM